MTACAWGRGKCPDRAVATVTTLDELRQVLTVTDPGPARQLCGNHLVTDVVTNPAHWTAEVVPLPDAMDAHSDNIARPFR